MSFPIAELSQEQRLSLSRIESLMVVSRCKMLRAIRRSTEDISDTAIRDSYQGQSILVLLHNVSTECSDPYILM